MRESGAVLTPTDLRQEPTPAAEDSWLAAVLRGAKAAAVLAGPAFVAAYAFGLVSVAKFLGRYGLQPTELLRVRYLTVGLSAIVLIAPTALCLREALSWSRAKPDPRRKWLRWMRPMVMAFLTGTSTAGAWLFWSGFLTSFEQAPGSAILLSYSITLGLGAAVAALLPFWFKHRDQTWTMLMTVAWSLTVCSALSNVLAYMPPWAGGYSVPPVTVLTREPALETYLAKGVIVVEATAERYIFWDPSEDSLIEVPSQYVIAIIGDTAVDSKSDGR